MKFKVPDSYIAKKRKSPYLYALFGVFIALLITAKSDFAWFSCLIGIVFIFFLFGTSWYRLKKEISELTEHELEINSDNLIFHNKGVVTTVELSQISRLVIDIKKGNVRSLNIKLANSPYQRLLPYENLNGLAEELKAHIPQDKVKVRKWFYL